VNLKYSFDQQNQIYLAFEFIVQFYHYKCRYNKAFQSTWNSVILKIIFWVLSKYLRMKVKTNCNVTTPGKTEIPHIASSARLIGVIETVLNNDICKYFGGTSTYTNNSQYLKNIEQKH
jgi:hypothetical protein